MVMGTKRVIAQHLDHPAIGDLPACALHDHAFKFCLDGPQSSKATFNFRQLRPCDGVRGSAGLIRSVRQAEKIADCFQREAQIARIPDEGDTFHRLAAIEPLVARTAFGFGKQANL